jgi:phospholipid-translocating ATPase
VWYELYLSVLYLFCFLSFLSFLLLPSFCGPGNLAREGLRTLVFGRRRLSDQEYNHFAHILHEAKTMISNREEHVREAIASIETNLELVGLTGVEDKLQPYVKESIEMLRTAGIKIWMLTGDKIETATCIAISTKLVSRNQSVFNLLASTKNEAYLCACGYFF